MSISRMAMILAALSLSACATTSPRYDDRGYRSGGYQQRGYDQRCGNCGRIEGIEQIYGSRQSTSGGGAILGAVVGGVLGSQVGSGSGRRAATVAGAVAGGVIGNEAERNRSGTRYEVFVQMDDGRRLLFELGNLGGLRQGDRVLVSGNQLYPR